MTLVSILNLAMLYVNWEGARICEKCLNLYKIMRILIYNLLNEGASPKCFFYFDGIAEGSVLISPKLSQNQLIL